MLALLQSLRLANSSRNPTSSLEYRVTSSGDAVLDYRGPADCCIGHTRRQSVQRLWSTPQRLLKNRSGSQLRLGGPAERLYRIPLAEEKDWCPRGFGHTIGTKYRLSKNGWCSTRPQFERLARNLTDRLIREGHHRLLETRETLWLIRTRSMHLLPRQFAIAAKISRNRRFRRRKQSTWRNAF
jgi:hypothetical protein